MNDVKPRKVKETCCESFKTPKGRCYTCPQTPEYKDPDEEYFM